MKKLMLGICISMLVLLGIILMLSKDRVALEQELYYTIPQIYSYLFEEDKTMSFSIYANSSQSLISLKEKNTYTLVCEENRYQVKETEIKKMKDCEIDGELFYKYDFIFPILSISANDMILRNCKLEIKNESFIIESLLGDIFIYHEAYPTLDFTDLYGNYTYIDKELHFIGFTIALDSKYKKLDSISIGKAYSPLNFIEKDILYDSEREIRNLPYSLIAEEPKQDSISLNAEENYYFIPIAYENLYLIVEACIVFKIDGELFYIPDFLFLANDISLKNYPKTKVEGKHINA